MASNCMKNYFKYDTECQKWTWEMMNNYLSASGIMWEMEYYVFSCQGNDLYFCFIC